MSRVGQVEAGEAVRPVPGHGDPQRLQPLQGRRYVQDGLHARADHRDPGAGQQAQVGRLVLRHRPLPVDAAQPSGREHPHARESGEQGGRRHGGRPARAAGLRERQVPVPQLADAVLVGDPLQLLLVQTDVRPPVQDGDRRRYGALLPYRLLQLPRHQQIARARQDRAR